MVQTGMARGQRTLDMDVKAGCLRAESESVHEALDSVRRSVDPSRWGWTRKRQNSAGVVTEW